MKKNSVIWSEIKNKNKVLRPFPQTEYLIHEGTSNFMLIVKSIIDKITKK